MYSVTFEFRGYTVNAEGNAIDELNLTIEDARGREVDESEFNRAEIDELYKLANAEITDAAASHGDALYDAWKDGEYEN